MDALLAEVRDGNSALQEWEGVPGLHLRFDFLSANGADPALLHSWRHGHSLGASPVVPRQARNHPSVTSQLAWAEREWDRLAETGKVSFFPVDAPPPKHLNVNPCGLILKPRPGADAEADESERFKARLIVDLRRGGVNECMPNADVAYGTLDQAVARMSAGSWLFVLDLRDCFFNWRVSDADSYALGFYSPGRRQFGKYNYLPFGLKPAPGINDTNVKEILRILRLRTEVDILDFVDDLLGAAPDEHTAWQNLRRAVRFLLRCGIPISAKPSGIRAPARRQSWIGWVFDTVECIITVPAEKTDRCRELCAAVLEADQHRTLRSKQLASAVGLASHIAELLPQLRRRLHPLWADFNASGVYSAWRASPLADPPVTLSDLSRAALAHICSALGTPPVRSLHCGGGPLSMWGHKSPEFADWANLARKGAIRVVECDASKRHGWSYHLCWDSRVVADTWPDNFESREAQPNSLEINYKELWVAVQCLLRESSCLKGWRILFRLDNSAAVHYVNVRYGRIPSLESLAHRFESAERTAQCWALALHIPGKSNVIADAGSRSLDFARSWREDQYRDAALRKTLFQEVESRCGVQFTLDLFADRLGMTALAHEWRFPELSAFEAELRGHAVWAHPPRALLKETFQFLNAAVADNADLRVVILCPDDPGAPWFRPSLLSKWHRIRSWPAGSDLFRWPSDRGLSKGPASDLPYIVLQSWLPNRRKRKR